MRLKWTRRALRDFQEAQHYIAQDNVPIAQTVPQRISDAAQTLTENPQMGRPGEAPGTREWVVTSTPYLIVYRIKGQVLEILRVWHGRQDWKNQPTN
ncbi:type II toxin-antitoxin system RelE/ParE family toxin [Hydrocarboniphaga sp.]|uniref:type II toxin-antitoxin system RelE/ParE family toxin n=1 Tax=Hydrocarboniphaga sp. TaxID=2033016 RepID=UPI002604564E|nr:type II toxin-antitoxin system RelE/ParE family toxin [Hydrocarboniphaga sp.]